MSYLPDELTSADNHLSITDALLRFGAGTDNADTDLLVSAFAPDAVIDFGPCGRKLGLDFEPLQGRDTIVGFLAGTAALQLTSHVVTNSRTHVRGDGASVRALVDATHVVRADRARRFRMMNWYDAELVRHQDAWRIEHLLIDNIWFEGDPHTMLHREG